MQVLPGSVNIFASRRPSRRKGNLSNDSIASSRWIVKLVIRSMKTSTGRLKLELTDSGEVSAPRDLKLIARCKQIYVTAAKFLEKEEKDFCDLRLVEVVKSRGTKLRTMARPKRNFYWL